MSDSILILKGFVLIELDERFLLAQAQEGPLSLERNGQVGIVIADLLRLWSAAQPQLVCLNER